MKSMFPENWSWSQNPILRKLKSFWRWPRNWILMKTNITVYSFPYLIISKSSNVQQQQKKRLSNWPWASTTNRYNHPPKTQVTHIAKYYFLNDKCNKTTQNLRFPFLLWFHHRRSIKYLTFSSLEQNITKATRKSYVTPFLCCFTYSSQIILFTVI